MHCLSNLKPCYHGQPSENAFGRVPLRLATPLIASGSASAFFCILGMDDQIIDVSCRAADKFVTAFYDAIDSNKHTLSQLYGPKSIMLWNGNPLGPAQIIEFLLKLPISTHNILSYDSHPVQASNGVNILVSVNGVVTYKNMSKKLFNQSFLLTKEETGQCLGFC